MRDSKSLPFFFFVIMFIGFIFFKAGFEKLINGNLPEELPGILSMFAKGNPNIIVKNYLNSFAIPNSFLLAYAVIFGELLTGLSLMSSAVYFILNKKKRKIVTLTFILGLFSAALMNLNYWLSSGWMSPSTYSLNLLMLGISLLGLVYAFKELIPSHKKVNNS